MALIGSPLRGFPPAVPLRGPLRPLASAAEGAAVTAHPHPFRHPTEGRDPCGGQKEETRKGGESFEVSWGCLPDRCSITRTKGADQLRNPTTSPRQSLIHGLQAV